MPLSRAGKLYYTAEQYAVAHEASALEYAKAAGYDLVREGTMYHLREHDSMIFTGEGVWHWNSRDLHGKALEFLTQYEGKDPVAAVLLLAGELTHTQSRPNNPPTPYKVKPAVIPPKPFELPKPAGSFRRLFAYLCTTRRLDAEIVQELVQDKRIYESVHSYTTSDTGEVKQLHNAVFVGFDQNEQPASAFQRGLNSFGAAYKGDVPSSNKCAVFELPGKTNTSEVAVFEAAIDAISHATITKLGEGDYKEISRIAIGGIAHEPVVQYLSTHPAIKTITLCLDNDAAGQLGAQRIQLALEQAGYTADAGYTIMTELPGLGKDWNEFLDQWRNALEQASNPIPEMEGDELEP